MFPSPTRWVSVGGRRCCQDCGVKYFVGLLALLGLTAGVTVAGYNLWEHSVSTRTGADDNGGVIAGGPASSAPPTAPAPAPTQVTVTGTVTALHVEGAVLPPLALPLTITTPERGGGSGATIKGITVDGKPSGIEWDAGLSLKLNGDGGTLLLAPVNVDADADNVFISFGTAPHGFSPGSYRVDTPVAVGTGGLATPMTSVTFVATDASTVAFRGNASTTLTPRDLSIQGPGKVVLAGDLTVVHADGSTAKAAMITLEAGPFQLAITPVTGGYTLQQATLQGVIQMG
jgi:hypothetical protein